MNKLATFFLLLPCLLLAQGTNSNEDINRKLDLIINKLSNLDERVTEIE